ncbi:MAG: S8 family serine peptidase [Mycobacteriales bacterium]|nr:S8 family serine peptidase [Mycobacteriales bacterium]
MTRAPQVGIALLLGTCVVVAPAATAAPLAQGAPVSQGAQATAPVRVVVQADSVEAAAQAVRRVGGSVTRELAIVDGVAASIPVDAQPRLASSAGVRAVTPDASVHVQADPSTATDTSSSYPRPVVNRETNAEAAHALGITGKGVVVALLDTGITPSPDLMTSDGSRSRVLPVEDPLPADRSKAVESLPNDLGASLPDVDDVAPRQRATVACVNFSGEASCDDSYGHGTFLAGLIAGNGAQSGGLYKGTAPDADLISVKIAGRDGSADVSKVLAGIQWVTSFAPRYGIRVLNLSLGTDSPVSHTVDPLNLAVQRAWASGLVVTVAASNRGPSAGTISKPGDDPLVITVGAVNDRGTPAVDDDRVPDFSGRGPTRHGIAKPDLVAPGAKVVSLQAPGSALAAMPGAPSGPYRAGSGTSMATAVTSGAVALLLQQRSTLTPDAVKTRLTAGAQRIQARDPLVVGAGLLDIVRAGLSTAAVVSQVRDAFETVGSLQGSRGTVLVTPTCTTGDPLDPVRDVFCPEQLAGQTTGQLREFDPQEFRDSEWTGSSWYESQWTGSSWYGSSWYGSSWYGSSWYGETDDGSSSGERTFFGVPLPGGAWYGAWD